jgi:hypothetical protein
VVDDKYENENDEMEPEAAVNARAERQKAKGHLSELLMPVLSRIS